MKNFEGIADIESHNIFEKDKDIRFDSCKSCGKYFEIDHPFKEICNRCIRFYNMLINQVKKNGTKILDYYT